MLQKSTRILLLLVVSGLLLSWPISYFFIKWEELPGQEELRELDQLAEELLTSTKKGDYDFAREHMQLLAQRFPNQVLPAAIRLESLNALTETILAAKQQFLTPQVQEEKLLWHAIQVRLAMDALTHPNQPMWREYQTSFFQQLQQMMEAAVERKGEELRHLLDDNYQLFLAIRPAMGVQISEKLMTRISSAYGSILKELRSQSLDWLIIRDALRELNGAMQEVFLGEDKSASGDLMAPGSPFSLIVSITAFVTLALTYVGWKKYVAEHRLS